MSAYNAHWIVGVRVIGVGTGKEGDSYAYYTVYPSNTEDRKTVTMDNAENSSMDEMKLRRRIRDSRLLSPELKNSQCSIVYSPRYNIGFFGLESLHPFDSRKWEKVHDFLVESGRLGPQAALEPNEASTSDLLVVHTQSYLNSLRWSCNLAYIVEVGVVALLPNCLVRKYLLTPMRYQTGGSVLAARLALERGWAINIGGGFHHASSEHGGGFCVYADITLAVRFLFEGEKRISSAMIVDLDAHQGNGHERDFANDHRVYILDMFNSDIYPHDHKAKSAITRPVALRCMVSDAEYLERLEQELQQAFDAFQPDIIVYNAGTDCLRGDPLGLLDLSAQAIVLRDEIVFENARRRKTPIVMLTSGGYTRATARIIADSILNLDAKRLIRLCGESDT